MSGSWPDPEVARAAGLLRHEVRHALMAFYVTCATTPLQISRTVDIPLPALAHHTQVLLAAGAIEGTQAPSGDTARQVFGATELGVLGMSLLDEEAEAISPSSQPRA